MKKYYHRSFERALLKKIVKIVAEDLERFDKVHHFNLNEIRTIGSKLNKSLQLPAIKPYPKYYKIKFSRGWYYNFRERYILEIGIVMLENNFIKKLVEEILILGIQGELKFTSYGNSLFNLLILPRLIGLVYWQSK